MHGQKCIIQFTPGYITIHRTAIVRCCLGESNLPSRITRHRNQCDADEDSGSRRRHRKYSMVKLYFERLQIQM